MGWYTSVVVHVSILEEDDEQGNLLLLPELQTLGRFYALPDASHIYAGTTKGSHINTLLKGIATIKWEYPESVQVWYKDEHDEEFRLVHGVEETDPRIQERDELLREADEWIRDLETTVAFQHSWELSQLKTWRERFNRLYNIEEDQAE
jgi:hypothetical protein